MQLSFDAADRLVELVEASRGPIPAARGGPLALRARLGADGDRALAARRRRLGRRAARLARCLRRARRCSRARGRRSRSATFVVFDLETTGLSPARSRIVEIGAQRVEAARGSAPRFETLVNPGVPLPVAITALTGIGRSRRARRHRGPIWRCGASSPSRATRFSSRTTRGSTWGSSIAPSSASRAGGSQRRSSTRSGSPGASSSGRTSRFGLQPLSHFFGTSVDAVPPRARRCLGHRRDPDRADRARAGARRRDGRRSRRAVGAAGPAPAREALARRRAHRRRPARTSSAMPGGRCSTSAAPAISAPGCARTSRASGSGPPSRRPSARWRTSSGSAAGASSRPRSTSCGSCASSARLRTRAGTRPDRHVYLRRRGARWVCVSRADPARPDQRAASLARRAAQALDGFEGDDPRDGAPRPPAAAAAASRADLRFEDAARLRDRIAALEQVRRADRRARRACATCRPASSCRRSSRGWCGRVFVAGRRRLRGARSRAEAVARSRSRPGWQTCAAGLDGELEAACGRRAPPDRVASSGGRRPSSASWRSIATRSWPRRTG